MAKFIEVSLGFSYKDKAKELITINVDQIVSIHSFVISLSNGKDISTDMNYEEIKSCINKAKKSQSENDILTFDDKNKKFL